jgi:hypothetical protein
VLRPELFQKAEEHDAMQSISTPYPRTLSTEPARRLGAIIEVIDGELNIYPIASTDVEERTILDALRFVIDDGKKAAA